MTTTLPKSLSVHVELPIVGDENLSQNPELVAQELRLLWILNSVRNHRISQGKGAELAGMTRYDFMMLMGKHQIPVFDYSPEEFKEELDAIQQLVASR